MKWGKYPGGAGNHYLNILGLLRLEQEQEEVAQTTKVDSAEKCCLWYTSVACGNTCIWQSVQGSLELQGTPGSAQGTVLSGKSEKQ